MCITFGKAHLSNTNLYAGEAEYNGKNVHVLAYQNKAENLSGKPNAMILPLPSKQEMSPENIIDTRAFPSFLKNIGDASKHRTRSLGFSKNFAAAGAQVFESGSYTVVLTNGGNVASLVQALQKVSEAKRPELSIDFLDEFIKLYPNQHIAVCCWEGEIKAEPLLWWFEPQNSDRLFLPAMDAHDGSAPKVGARVEVDHLVSVGGADGSSVIYTDTIPNQYRSLLPSKVYGAKFEEEMVNGDFFCQVAELQSNANGRGKPPMLRRGIQLTDNTIQPSAGQPMYGWT